jgi:hypothetical protein
VYCTALLTAAPTSLAWPSDASAGTLDLLAGATEHEGVSRETVRRRLAEEDLKPRRRTSGASG